MKDVCIDVLGCRALGDTLAVTPTLRKLYNSYGKKISVEAYNQKCREAVLRYKKEWDDITNKMGYWVDLNNPYITFSQPATPCYRPEINNFRICY